MQVRSLQRALSAPERLLIRLLPSSFPPHRFSNSTAAAAGPPGGRGQKLDNNDLPILFWDEMPDNYEENPDYIALQAVLTEDTTPESRAANFKEQGNKKLEVANRTRKKMFYHEALDFYTRGIKENCSDTK